MAQKTPSLAQPFQLLSFMWKVRMGIEDPADTTAIFMKDTLRFFCFWADSDEYPKKSIIFKAMLWLNHIIYVTATIATWAYLIVGEMNIIEFAGAFCFAVALIQFSSKTFFMQIRRKSMTYIINTINEMSHDLLKLSKQDKDIQKLRNYYFFNEMFLMIAFVLLALITNMFSMLKIAMPLPPTLPGNAVFPFDTTPYGPGFILAYIFMSVAYLSIGVNYSLIDPVIGCNFSQTVLHFHILGIKLRNLGYREKELYKNDKKVFNKVCFQKLNLIIREYKYLEDLVNTCNETLSPFFRLLVLASMSHFVFLTFVASITLRKDIGIFLTFLSFLSYVAGTFFYWCFLGNQLQIKSSDLLRDAYFCNWIDCDQKFKVELLRFMIRVRKPLQYHAKPIFIFNYDMFTSITRKAFSYLAVLQDINAKN